MSPSRSPGRDGEREAAQPERDEARRPATANGMTGRLLALQRSAGNRATSQLIRRQGGGGAQAEQLASDMRAVDVLKLVEGGRARAQGLQFSWYVANIDKPDGFSTAFNLGRDCAWQIHTHRNARGKVTVATVQAAGSVGNQNVTRGMELNNVGNLAQLGIPATFDPRQTSPVKRWQAMP